MAFKVKDLMINILPSGKSEERAGPELCPQCSLQCSPCSYITCGYTCGCSNCSHCTGPTNWSKGVRCEVESARPEELAALKAELKQALLDIEAKERALKEASGTLSLDDAELLEKKLTEALTEVKARKAKLKGKKKP